MMAPQDRRTIGLVYLAGLGAGIALGRFIPLLDGLRQDFPLSQFAFGGLVSTITVVAAVLALPAGMWLRQGDLGRFLAGGLAILLVAGLAQAAAPSVGVIFMARVVEGLGYLLVVITGPLVLAVRCMAEGERIGLALWSTFIPVGMALAAGLGTVAGREWRMATLVGLIPCAVALVAVHRWLRGTVEADQPDEQRLALSRPVMALALAFSLIALLSVTLPAVLPRLGSDREIDAAVGGATTALVSLASVPGGLLTGWLLARGRTPRSFRWSAAAIPLAAIGIFLIADWWVVTTGAAVLMFASGLLLAAMYAAMPQVAQSAGQLRQGYGALVQAGSIGTLIGPPTFGLAVTQMGWGVAPALMTVITALGMAAFAVTFRVEVRQP